MPSPRRRSAIHRTVAVLACLACLGAGGAALAAGGKAAGKAAKPTRAVKVSGDHRAWNAIKALVPADVTVAGSVNVNAMRGTATFQKLSQLATKDGDLRDGLSAAKDACGIDVVDAVADVAFATRDSGQPIVAVAFRSLGRADLEKCAMAIATKHGKTFTTRSEGKLTRYESDGEVFHVAWLPGDVAVLGGNGDKALLESMLGGKGAFVGKNPAARATIAAVPAGAPLWGVYAKEERLDRYAMKHAAVWVEASGGKVRLEARLTMDSPGSATQAATDWARERDQMAAGGGAPGALAAMIKQLQITSEGDAVRIVFEVSERDLVGLMSLF
jgi:hypothetical protein